MITVETDLNRSASARDAGRFRIALGSASSRHGNCTDLNARSIQIKRQKQRNDAIDEPTFLCGSESLLTRDDMWLSYIPVILIGYFQFTSSLIHA